MNAPNKPLRPLEIEELAPTEMVIRWNDGTTSFHRYRTLRFNCWCAHCRDELTGEELIRFEEIPEDIRPRSIEPVGNYALRFHWSDGHSTGLYSYAKLREWTETFLSTEHKHDHDHDHDHGDGHQH